MGLGVDRWFLDRSVVRAFDCLAAAQRVAYSCLTTVSSRHLEPQVEQLSVRTGDSVCRAWHSEENEDLLDVAFDVLDLLADDVEADSLREGAALTNSHDITDLDTEGRRAMGRHSLMALLEPVILLDVMKVIPSDDDSPRHFSRDDNTPNQERTSAMSII